MRSARTDAITLAGMAVSSRKSFPRRTITRVINPEA